MENGKVKVIEPNKGKHIAVAGDINTILIKGRNRWNLQFYRC
jgi:hypothetical protein